MEEILLPPRAVEAGADNFRLDSWPNPDKLNYVSFCTYSNDEGYGAIAVADCFPDLIQMVLHNHSEFPDSKRPFISNQTEIYLAVPPREKNALESVVGLMRQIDTCHLRVNKAVDLLLRTDLI